MAPMHATFFLTFILTLVVRCVWAETHTITFDNQCGHGTPQLIQQGNILSTGKPFKSNGPFISGIAYLQTGDCLLNGEGCSLVEMTLVNPTCAGCGSSTDISLIPPHAFSVPVSFSYSGGCSGQGATCTSATCKTAFFVPDDNQVQVECQDEDVDLLITFCPGATGGGGTPPKASSSAIQATPTKASIGSTTESLTQVIAAPTSLGSAKASQIASVPSTPVPVPNAPKCATKRAARRRRRAVPVPISEESQRHRRGGLRMAHAHSNARKDF